MTYVPALDSLRTHPVPQWYHDAKLGIFIHWGLYSVPGWAELSGEPTRIIAEKGWRYWFAHNAYAEWYQNSLRVPGSATQSFHRQTYGENFPYQGFAPLFEQAAQGWEPSAWAQLFKEIGARYVVLTTKHHDGYTLWHSRTPNPQTGAWHAQRDYVGELGAAVRNAGMRYGVYYSGGLDWTFTKRPILDFPHLLTTCPAGEAYARYVDAHWRELIQRYQPDILWNDISYPAQGNLLQLFAEYYNAFPEGVVNDRFNQINLGKPGTLRHRLITWGITVILGLMLKLKKSISAPSITHADFTTPEYQVLSAITPKKWESTRGLGYSFGYNRNETEAHQLDSAALVRQFVDIVSKNGNLLLNVGPMADGTIPPMQCERLLALGNWLQVNGEAIYATRPWLAAESQSNQNTPIRFTCTANALYAHLMQSPPPGELTLKGVQSSQPTRVCLLGQGGMLAAENTPAGLSVAIPAGLREQPVHVLKIEPIPHWAG